WFFPRGRRSSTATPTPCATTRPSRCRRSAPSWPGCPPTDLAPALRERQAAAANPLSSFGHASGQARTTPRDCERRLTIAPSSRCTRGVKLSAHACEMTLLFRNCETRRFKIWSLGCRGKNDATEIDFARAACSHEVDTHLERPIMIRVLKRSCLLMRPQRCAQLFSIQPSSL